MNCSDCSYTVLLTLISHLCKKIKQISLKAKIMFTSSYFLPFFTLVFKYLHSLVFFIMFVLKFLFLNFFIGSQTGIIRNCGTKLGNEAKEAVCEKRKYREGVQYQIGATAIPNWRYSNAKLESCDNTKLQ